MKAVIEKNKINWRSFDDQEGTIKKRWQVIGIPQIFLLDKDGVIRFNGRPTDKTLEPTLQRLLNEMGSDVDLSKLDEMVEKANEVEED